MPYIHYTVRILCYGPTRVQSQCRPHRLINSFTEHERLSPKRNDNFNINFNWNMFICYRRNEMLWSVRPGELDSVRLNPPEDCALSLRVQSDDERILFHWSDYFFNNRRDTECTCPKNYSNDPMVAWFVDYVFSNGASFSPELLFVWSVNMWVTTNIKFKTISSYLEV